MEYAYAKATDVAVVARDPQQHLSSHGPTLPTIHRLRFCASIYSTRSHVCAPAAASRFRTFISVRYFAGNFNRSPGLSACSRATSLRSIIMARPLLQLRSDDLDVSRCTEIQACFVAANLDHNHFNCHITTAYDHGLLCPPPQR